MCVCVWACSTEENPTDREGSRWFRAPASWYSGLLAGSRDLGTGIRDSNSTMLLCGNDGPRLAFLRCRTALRCGDSSYEGWKARTRENAAAGRRCHKPLGRKRARRVPHRTYRKKTEEGPRAAQERDSVEGPVDLGSGAPRKRNGVPATSLP